MTSPPLTPTEYANAAADQASASYRMAIGSEHLTSILVADTVASLMTTIAAADDSTQATADVLEVLTLRLMRGELEG